MKHFMDEEFLLDTQTARALYHGVAEKQPIMDYHCHVSPKEIAENRSFANLTQLWLEGDHYKWRLMRACGVPERSHHRRCTGSGEVPGMGRHTGAGCGQSPFTTGVIWS